MAQKYDWQKIEYEYVTSDISLRELSEKYHMAMSTLSKHAVEGKFSDKREKYRQKVAQKAVTRASTRDGKAIARLMTGTEKAIRELRKAITEDTLYGYIVQEPSSKDEATGETRPGGLNLQLMKKADTKALVNISTAIRNLAMATRVMYPEGDGDGEKLDHTGVVMMPEMEEEEDEE